MQFSLAQLAEITGGKLHGNPTLTVDSISIDSRSFVSGKHLLFVAIVGDNHNGHSYINELAARGIQNFLVEELPQNINVNFIEVKCTQAALQAIAAYHRTLYSLPILGITGSNGKTVVKEWLYQLLSPFVNIVRSPKSYNSQVGVPLSVLQLETQHQLAIFEAGISLPSEMSKLEPIIAPKIGIFTNVGEAHQEGFVNSQQKANEKVQLFFNSEFIIYCADYPEIKNAIEVHLPASVKRISWSMHGTNAVEVKKVASHTEITICTSSGTNSFSVPFTNMASIENAIHCFYFCKVLSKITKQNYLEKVQFSKLEAVQMRLEMMHGINGSTLINDAYNNDLSSLKIALETLTQQLQHKRRTVILSDIFQSGKTPDLLYQQVADMLVESRVDKLYAIGEEIEMYKHYFLPNTEFYTTTGNFLQAFRPQKFEQEVILLKGSRNFRFEKISRLLARKNHHTTLEINLDNLQHNLNYFRSLLRPATKIMVMVKAFSYGSGSYEIANWLQHQRVDYLGVAYADEGVELRKAGIRIPIMVMNVDTHNFEQIIRYNLEPELYSLRILQTFAAYTKSRIEASVAVHLKLDTGMRRLGFDSHELPELLHCLQSNTQFEVKSVFSHLVGTDEAQHDEFTQRQIARFQEISQQIKLELGKSFLCHVLNSAGIERHTDAQMDMVRLGIGLYGISQDNSTEVISTLKTYVSQIKKIKKGESVGYSRRWVAKRDSVIGTVPVGYADCIDRGLGNEVGYLLINGHKAPFIGNICMDMSMVDLTDIEAYEGIEAIVFGEQPSIVEIANALNTIPYELLTSVSPRVKRVYFQGE